MVGIVEGRFFLKSRCVILVSLTFFFFSKLITTVQSNGMCLF